MAITNQQQIHILGIVVGLFNAAPGEQFLSEFSDAVDNGLTEVQLANILAGHLAFTNGIMGGKNTTAAKVAVLMKHYGLVADGIPGSAASQAEAFFVNSINAGVGFDTIIIQAGVFLLNDAVPAEFIETANLYKNKITVAAVYSENNSSTDLATLQSPLVGLSGATEMTREEAISFLQEGGFIPGANSVTLDEAINGPLSGFVELSNVSDSFTLNIISADNSAGKGGAFDIGGDILVTLQDASGTTSNGDAETFTLNATINDDNNNSIAEGINARTITVPGVENLIISSTVASTDGSVPDTDAAQHTLTVKLIAADAETITITGDGGVALGSDTTPFSEATIGEVTEINAAGSTGKIMINFAGHAKSVTYTGSQGVDRYWGSFAGDTIKAGLGHDLINLEGAMSAQDVLVLEAVTDSHISDTNNDGLITILEDRGFDEIENFSVGSAATDDRIDLSFLQFSGIQRGIVDVTGKVPFFNTNISNIANLFSDTGGDRGLAFSEIAFPPGSPGTGTTSIVFIDANKDGDFTAADDMLIELMAVGSVTEEIFIF